ncbi:hypothetical protein HK102_007914, partial [Quaeritorhiza haematococci]
QAKSQQTLSQLSTDARKLFNRDVPASGCGGLCVPDFKLQNFGATSCSNFAAYPSLQRTTSDLYSLRSNLNLEKRQIEIVVGVVATTVIYIASITAYLFTTPQPQLPAPSMVSNTVSPDRIKTAGDCSPGDRSTIIDTVNRASVLLGRMLKDLDTTVSIAKTNKETTIRTNSNLAKAFGILK